MLFSLRHSLHSKTVGRRLLSSVEKRIKESFERQGMMEVMGAKLLSVKRGEVQIELPYSRSVTQQQNNFHGGAVGAIADIAAGYSGLTMAPEGSEVVTVEYKINFLASLSGGKLIAKGKVIKPGKRLIVTQSEVYHYSDDVPAKETVCAVLQQTLIPVEKKY